MPVPVGWVVVDIPPGTGVALGVCMSAAVGGGETGTVVGVGNWTLIIKASFPPLFESLSASEVNGKFVDFVLPVRYTTPA